VRSGYPLAAVEWLAKNRPGSGAGTDLAASRLAGARTSEHPG